MNIGLQNKNKIKYNREVMYWTGQQEDNDLGESWIHLKSEQNGAKKIKIVRITKKGIHSP